MLGAGGKPEAAGKVAGGRILKSAGACRGKYRTGKQNGRKKTGGFRKKPFADTEKDYRIYHLTARDMGVCTGGAVILSGCIAWLFYKSIWGFLVLPLAWSLLYWGQKRNGVKRQQQRLREQFRECIRVVASSMYSGYSVENAFLEAEKELTHLLGAQADMSRELGHINRQLTLNVPVESLLLKLADRSGVEEIFGFGQVFGYAKRNGSDFARILRDTSERIGEKIELEREIAAMVAAKRLEQRIMNVIPFGILLFVNLTSPGFLEMMYGGAFGRTVMTFCLLVYAGAFLLSERIMDIRV